MQKPESPSPQAEATSEDPNVALQWTIDGMLKDSLRTPEGVRQGEFVSEDKPGNPKWLKVQRIDQELAEDEGWLLSAVTVGARGDSKNNLPPEPEAHFLLISKWGINLRQYGSYLHPDSVDAPLPTLDEIISSLKDGQADTYQPNETDEEQRTQDLMGLLERAKPIQENTSQARGGRVAGVLRRVLRIKAAVALEQNSDDTAIPEESSIKVEPQEEPPEESKEDAAYREALKQPTPKEQTLISRDMANKEHRGGGDHFVELDNGDTGYFRGSGYRFERATYLVDKCWKFGVVPTTVIRKFPDSVLEGSFNEYIDNAEPLNKLERSDKLKALDEFQTDFYKIWILNYSIWHTDGTEQNVMVADKPYSKDHEHAFIKPYPEEWTWSGTRIPKTRQRGSFQDFYGVQAPEEVIEEAHNFLGDTIRQEVLLEQLEELMSEQDAKACVARMRHVAKLLTTKGKVDNEEEFAEYSPAES